jgi:hypothetical protein
MRFARQRALTLQVISKRSDPEFKARLEATAAMWLSLAVIDEQLSGWAADETEKSSRRA